MCCDVKPSEVISMSTCKVFCSCCKFPELKSDNAAQIEFAKCGSPNQEDSFWEPGSTKPWCGVKNKHNNCPDFQPKQ